MTWFIIILIAWAAALFGFGIAALMCAAGREHSWSDEDVQDFT